MSGNTRNDWGFYRVRALLALLVVGGFLAFLVYKNETTRSGGAELVLQTRPIDPRDIFFGHYAVLSYDIQNFAGDELREILDEEFRAEAERVAQTNGSVISSRKIENAPAYLLFKKDGKFHEPAVATLDLAKARASGMPFLRTKWWASTINRCDNGTRRAPDCGWRISTRPDLPRRYYADKETALALEERQRAGMRARRAQQRFEQCELRRAQAEPDAQADNGASLEDCENVTEPPLAEDFGAVLSASQSGDTVIKGVLVGDEKILDSLAGPRLTKSDLE